MTYCEPHLYSGVLPCPWPLCPKGAGEASFRFEGTLAERRRFRDPDGTTTFAWVIAGVTSAHSAAQLARRAVLAMNATPLPDEDAYLYHFTSAISARRILESADLWMTDYRDFRDRGEICHGLDVARATFAAICVDLHPTTQELLETVVAAPLEESVYVTCFCMLRDSPYHWQEYASDGAGAALVIDPLGFDDFLLAVDPFTIYFGRVAYTWDAKATLFTAMARYFDAMVRFDISRNVFKRTAYIREMTQLLAELLPMCKDVSFLREHEMRIIFSPHRARLLPSVPATRTHNGRRFVTMRDVLPEFRLPVDQVIVGPYFADDLAALPIESTKIHRTVRSG